MALEIEHKYLVKNTGYREKATKSYAILQGYLCREPDRTVRVRVKDDRGFITVKGRNDGATRLEFEYEVPLDDAKHMLGLCVPPVLEKIRYIVEYDGHTWEVDEFGGTRSGLVTAEIELRSEAEPYEIPDFIGENVTGNPAFYNSNL